MQGQPPTPDRYKASTLRAYNGRLATAYDSSIWVRLLHASEMDRFVLQVLGSRIASLSILDLGCATGRLLECLAKSGARRLAGADIAERIIETARTRLVRLDLDLDLRVADAEISLPWPDGTFDVITATGVIHHFCAPQAAFAEVHRALCPGGMFIIVDPCFFSPLRQIFNLWLRITPHQGDYRFRTFNQLKEILASHGWRISHVERVSWWAYGIVATRTA